MQKEENAGKRPQWLTVRAASGERITMRLPDNPQVRDVQIMLERVSALAEQSKQRMGGWSLTTGPRKRH